MKREHLKTKNYFKKRIDQRENFIFELKKILGSEDHTLSRKQQLTYAIFKEQFEMFTMHYSLGSDIESILPLFKEALETLFVMKNELCMTIEPYHRQIELVSIAVCIEIEQDVFQKLVTCLDLSEKDQLFDFIVSFRIKKRTLSSSILLKIPYKTLLELISLEQSERTKTIVKYLSGWYGKMKKQYWHDSHLQKDGGFFGYWCWEVAAFVKILGIPDNDFLAMPYYPKDLVHFKNYLPE